jgi:hypothetical protein
MPPKEYAELRTIVQTAIDILYNISLTEKQSCKGKITCLPRIEVFKSNIYGVITNLVVNLRYINEMTNKRDELDFQLY